MQKPVCERASAQWCLASNGQIVQHWILVLDCGIHYLEPVEFWPLTIGDIATRCNGFIKCPRCIGFLYRVADGKLGPVASEPIDVSILALTSQYLFIMPIGRCLKGGTTLNNRKSA